MNVLAFFGEFLCDRPEFLVAVCGEESDGGCDGSAHDGCWYAKCVERFSSLFVWRCRSSQTAAEDVSSLQGTAVSAGAVGSSMSSVNRPG